LNDYSIEGLTIMPRFPINRRLAAVIAGSLLLVSSMAFAAPEDVAVKAMDDYLESVDRGGATIFPEQLAGWLSRVEGQGWLQGQRPRGGQVPPARIGKGADS
jgi:hypothetical protein